jgi:hypothetical protein
LQDREKLLKLVEATEGWRTVRCKNGLMCYPPVEASDPSPVMVGFSGGWRDMRNAETELARRGWADPRKANRHPKGHHSAGDPATDVRQQEKRVVDDRVADDIVIDTVPTHKITVNTVCRPVDTTTLGPLTASIETKGLVRPGTCPGATHRTIQWGRPHCPAVRRNVRCRHHHDRAG